MIALAAGGNVKEKDLGRIINATHPATQKINMKSNLKKAFALLSNFPKLERTEQRKRLAMLEKLLIAAMKRQNDALLMFREIDQLRKERAYMLIQSGEIENGVKEIQSIVAGYEQSISEMHEEAAFQLAEAAIASFNTKNYSGGEKFARDSLSHAGLSNRISKTVINALELMQKNQERRFRRPHA